MICLQNASAGTAPIFTKLTIFEPDRIITFGIVMMAIQLLNVFLRT